MALATFSALCVDVNDLAAATRFWSGALGLHVETPEGPDDPVLRGAAPEQDVWLNLVPERHTVKNRVHLDLRVPSLDAFDGLARLSLPGAFPWTVLADAEGNEFCVFVDGAVDASRLKDLVVDAVDPAAIAGWWAEVLGGQVHDGDGYCYVSGVGGEAFEDLDFVPVPEPKTVKNRVHWDVRLRLGASVDDLVTAGARVLRTPDAEISWTVMADPEGNEFCVVGD